MPRLGGLRGGYPEMLRGASESDIEKILRGKGG